MSAVREAVEAAGLPVAADLRTDLGWGEGVVVRASILDPRLEPLRKAFVVAPAGAHTVVHERRPDRELHVGVRLLMAKLEVDAQRERERECIGWIVLSIDDERVLRGLDPSYLADGLYESAEQALVAAGEQDRMMNADLPEGEVPWKHVVVPVYPKGAAWRNISR